jgi:hypothetical protein
MDESGHESGNESSKRTGRAMGKRIGFIVGLVLLVGAAVYLLADPETLWGFVKQIRHAPMWAVVVVLVGPMVNWVFVGLCLHSLVRRHGVVGRGEMLALVGSAWLLNHLPMRPGLVGRIGYHSKVNQIRVRDSVEASVWSMVHAGIANAVALAIVLMLPSDMSLVSLILALLVPIGVELVLSVLAFARSEKFGYLLLGLVFRNADLLVWMVRYAGAFAMLGIEITPMQIVLITAASQIAQVIPFTGAGFGFREWGVGVAARLTSSGATITMRTAIGADVINRIAETVIVIPLGLICTGIVARRFTRWTESVEGVGDGVDGGGGSAEDQARGDGDEQDEPGQGRE